jgi:serine/threonine protein phosphatase PrpC
LIAPKVFKLKGTYLFAVADGHGCNGHLVSSYIKESLASSFMKAYKSHSQIEVEDLRTTEALKQTYKQLQAGLSSSDFDVSYSGSTLVTVYVRGCTLFCANVGDSRAVMGRYNGTKWSATALSRDHKPNDADEAERIFKSSGVVQKCISRTGEAIGPYRVWSADNTSSGLAMSRSLGDCMAQNYGVSSDPEIMQVELKSTDKFVILGSDGLWEYVQNQEAVELVRAKLESRQYEESASHLTKVAAERWDVSSDRQDDITVVVIFLRLPSVQ